MSTEFLASTENEVPDVPFDLNDASPIFEKRGPGFTIADDVIVCKALKYLLFIILWFLTKQNMKEQCYLMHTVVQSRPAYLTATIGGVYRKTKILARFQINNSLNPQYM